MKNLCSLDFLGFYFSLPFIILFLFALNAFSVFLSVSDFYVLVCYKNFLYSFHNECFNR